MQVDVSHAIANEAYKWAKENCPSYITVNVKLGDNFLDETEMYVTFYFGEEKEATLFALRWA